jgi:UDP-GlcNAc:undecaprenyl-phosphate GlcNAc-1-phosphate transferase
MMLIKFTTAVQSGFLWVPVLSFALTALLIPVVKLFAIRFGVVAAPAADVLQGPAQHRGVPLLGGVAMMGAVMAALAMAHALPVWLLVGGIGLTTIGTIDDAMVLKPRQKLAAQILISVAVVQLYHSAAPLAPWRLTNSLLEVFWLLSATNAYNLVDGLDGLAGGIGIAATAAIAAVGLLHGNLHLSYQALALAGALAAFMVYNFHPASIFMGDCGALPIGLILGVLALEGGGYATNSRLSRYIFPILVLIGPLLDTAIVSVTRIATGNSISRRGLDHSHHRLLHLGLTTRTAVAVCWAVAILGGACAVTLTIMPHRYVVMTLPLVVLVFAVAGLFMMDLTFDSRPPGLAYGYLQGAARFILNIAYKRRIVEIALDLSLITAAWFGANLLRQNFLISERGAAIVIRQLPWIIPPTYLAFVVAGVYRGIWRYAGISELIRFANGSVLTGILIALMKLTAPFQAGVSVVVLDVILLFNLLFLSRMSFRILRKGIHRMATPRERVLVVGAGVAGSAAARYVFSGQNRNVRLIGFIDDDAFKVGKLVGGYGVLGVIDDLERVFESYGFDQIMLAADSLDEKRIASVRRFAESHGITLSRFSIQIDQVTGFQGEGRAVPGSKPILVEQRQLNS